MGNTFEISKAQFLDNYSIDYITSERLQVEQFRT